MSNPYMIPPAGGHNGHALHIYPGSFSPPHTDFGPFFDDFIPIATPTQEEERLAAVEEEKRRRNTAASARFRVKKKERGQALETTAMEMTQKVTRLEERVKQLEFENGWLRDLITEKSQKQSDPDGGEKKSQAGQEADDEADRGLGKHTDGVGTSC